MQLKMNEMYLKMSEMIAREDEWIKEKAEMESKWTKEKKELIARLEGQALAETNTPLYNPTNNQLTEIEPTTQNTVPKRIMMRPSPSPRNETQEYMNRTPNETQSRIQTIRNPYVSTQHNISANDCELIPGAHDQDTCAGTVTKTKL